jgi:conjugative transposon TraN protein
MKCKCVIEIVIILNLLSSKIFAQNENYFFVPSSSLTVTCNKTTNLIFPFTVQSVDRGSKDILVQQPKGTENIVQLKADKPNFVQTNLSVITVDGSLYSFIVDYAAQPSQLNIIVENKNQRTDDSEKAQAIKLSSGSNEALCKAVAQKIETSKTVHGKKTSIDQIQLKVNGIYVNNDVIYFRFRVKNNSNISYDLGNIRFSIKDREKSARTANQEIELKPVFTYGSIDKVQADSTTSFIVALAKFTLPDSKYLSVRMIERNGNRNLDLFLRKRHLKKMETINN